MTETSHATYEVIAGKIWLSLMRGEDALDSEVWFVRVSDGTDHADGDSYADRFGAMAELRQTASTLGHPIPYEAPVFEEEPVAADPERTAGDVFWDWHNRLRLLRATSPEAELACDEMEKDREFRDNWEAILNITPKGNSWIYTAIRVACRHVSLDHDKEAAQALNDIPTYGLF